jgi:endonuclease-3 related protein
MMTSDKLMQMYQLLIERFGPQGWWPGQSTTEIIIGAILTQNTSWKNVEKAIANLNAAHCLDFDKLNAMHTDFIAELIRPAGYYNIKAARLKNFVNWLFAEYRGDLHLVENVSTDLLREKLLSIKGIGRETADSILLYAFERPVFVIDTYTFRVLSRHYLIDEYCEYDQMKDLFERNLKLDTKLFNEFHALFVCVGKDFCKPRPKCQGCPLDCLPHSREQGD